MHRLVISRGKLTTMNKFILLLLLIGIIGAGIGYSIISSPDLPAQLLFKKVLNEFANHSADLEQDFLNNGVLKPQNKKLSLAFELGSGSMGTFEISMVVSQYPVNLNISSTASELASQSIILEPTTDNSEVRWKCINGSVLVRVRTKNCRLGLGELRSDMLQY